MDKYFEILKKVVLISKENRDSNVKPHSSVVNEVVALIKGEVDKIENSKN